MNALKTYTVTYVDRNDNYKIKTETIEAVDYTQDRSRFDFHQPDGSKYVFLHVIKVIENETDAD